MASKLARKIAQLLVGNDCVLTYKVPNLLDIIDRAVKDQSISKKEVARLQESERILSSAIDANNDLLRTNSELKRELSITDREAGVLAKWLVAEKKISQELQEKLTISIENGINYELNKKIREQDSYIEQLEVTNRTLRIAPVVWRWSDELTVEENVKGWMDSVGWKNEYKLFEPLIPPPCLKPLDAMKWSEQTMFASEVR